METTFQELKIGDEFTDETNIMYRKIHDSAFCVPRHETTAMVINHGILGGTELLINPGQRVNKIVKLTRYGDMKPGDVFVSNAVTGNKKFYYMRLQQLGAYDLQGNIFHENGVCEFYQTDEFEIVGHINLVWPQ
jgi:hypothetical protein